MPGKESQASLILRARGRSAEEIDLGAHVDAVQHLHRVGTRADVPASEYQEVRSPHWTTDVDMAFVVRQETHLRKYRSRLDPGRAIEHDPEGAVGLVVQQQHHGACEAEIRKILTRHQQGAGGGTLGNGRLADQ